MNDNKITGIVSHFKIHENYSAFIVVKIVTEGRMDNLQNSCSIVGHFQIVKSNTNM